jgi:hypothetical protein
MQGAPSRHQAKLVPAPDQDPHPVSAISTVELIVIGANGWGPRWHCVRDVIAITKKRFSLPNCAKRTAHS